MAEPTELAGDRDRRDVEAIERLCSGDQSALAELYDRHGTSAFGLALKILRNESEAEDVVHDAFVALVGRANQYRSGRGTVAAWLITAVRNLALDRIRRRVRRARIVDKELKHLPVEDAPRADAMISQGQAHDRVKAALLTLPEAQRSTLEIAFFEGLSYPEIAARESVPLGTIKSRAARALHALRAALEDLDPISR